MCTTAIVLQAQTQATHTRLGKGIFCDTKSNLRATHKSAVDRSTEKEKKKKKKNYGKIPNNIYKWWCDKCTTVR